MVSSLATDGNKCACMRTRVGIEGARASARARGREHASARPRQLVIITNLLVRLRARASADACADRIDGLLQAGGTFGRTGGQLALSRAGDKNLSIPLWKLFEALVEMQQHRYPLNLPTIARPISPSMCLVRMQYKFHRTTKFQIKTLN